MTTFAPIAAKALITWTPLTFYIVAAIIQWPLVSLAFRLLGADTERAGWINALVVAIATGVVGYVTRDMGVLGLLATAGASFGSALFVSAGDAPRSIAVGIACFAVWPALALGVVPRTPLTHESVGGFSAACFVGLDEEAFNEENSPFK